MRIEGRNNMYHVSQKAKETENSSGDQIRRAVQNHFDQFENQQIPRDIDSALEDRANNLNLSSNSSELPEIIGKANEPNIPEEALDRLRQQVESARQKK